MQSQELSAQQPLHTDNKNVGILEDFSSLHYAFAYGDEPINYSYLDDLHSEGEPRPLAAAESSACANCEVLKKEIEFLKQNQMPGTNFM